MLWSRFISSRHWEKGPGSLISRGQGLPMRGRRNAPLARQPAQERLDFRTAYAGRMAHAMEADERPAPVDLGFLGAPAVVQHPNPLPELVEHLRGAQRGQKRHACADRRLARHWPVAGVNACNFCLRREQPRTGLANDRSRRQCSVQELLLLSADWYWMKKQSTRCIVRSCAGSGTARGAELGRQPPMLGSSSVALYPS